MTDDVFSGLGGYDSRNSRRYADRPGEWIMSVTDLTRGTSQNKKGKNYKAPFVAGTFTIEQIIHESPDTERGQVENHVGARYSWMKYLNDRDAGSFDRNMQALQEFLAAITKLPSAEVTSDVGALLFKDGGAAAKGMKFKMKVVANPYTNEETGKTTIYHNVYFDPAP